MQELPVLEKTRERRENSQGIHDDTLIEVPGSMLHLNAACGDGTAGRGPPPHEGLCSEHESGAMRVWQAGIGK